MKEKMNVTPQYRQIFDFHNMNNNWHFTKDTIKNVNSLQFIVSMNVDKYSRVHSNNREDDAKQCYWSKLIDKLYSDIYDASCKSKKNIENGELLLSRGSFNRKLLKSKTWKKKFQLHGQQKCGWSVLFCFVINSSSFQLLKIPSAR